MTRKLLNDCRYCDNKGSNCVRHKDVALPELPMFRLGSPVVFPYEGGVAYTSTSERLISQAVVQEEDSKDVRG